MPLIACPIYQQAKRNSSYPAVIDQNKIITYRELDSRIENFKIGLRNLGVTRTDRVAIFAVNCIDYVAILFALWRLRAIACVLNTRNPIPVIQNQLKQINAKFIITDNKNILNSKTIQTNKISLSSFSSLTYQLPHTTYHYQTNQPATIMFTSGSESKPKAALLSFGNHYFNALGSNENIKLKKEDRWLLSLPLYHVSGMGILFRSLLAGAVIVIPNSNKNLISSIHQFSITHVSLVTTQLQELLKTRQKFPKLKAILVGGSAIPESLIKNSIQQKLPIHISYGLTEMASQVATSPKLSVKTKQLEVNILKYRQIKISSDNEILLKGQTFFQGYVKGNRIIKPVDPQGWFHSGDLGIIKNNKFLTVLGRKDNMFISGGENIQPEEIERHLQKIKEVEAAIVFPLQDTTFGFRPIAFMKWKTGGQLSPKRLIKILKTKLPGYKIPIKFLPWPKEINPGHKIIRQNFKKYLRLA